MALLNPEILSWARETAGLDRETAARKIGLSAARGVSGKDRLASIEAGDAVPATALLRKMATQYRRPLITFYMQGIPEPAPVGQDFRTLPERGAVDDPLLQALLRDMKARQIMAREVLQTDEDAPEIGFVGASSRTSTPERLAADITTTIGFDRQDYRARNSVEEAFSYLRGLVEAQGAFVLLAGDCGHWSTTIAPSTFRGFALADKFAPFIVVNDQDARSAWSFTLLHEMAHLLLGETGVSGGTPDIGLERLCNDAAALVLVEEAEIDALAQRLDGGDADLDAIGTLADQARISRSMIAYRLLRIGGVNETRWRTLGDTFRAQWQSQKRAQQKKDEGKAGGPNWHVVKRHRLGAALLAVARQGMADGSLTPGRAARMLGIKSMTVYPLLDQMRKARA